MMPVCGKEKTLCGFHCISLFHSLWKNRWKIKKCFVTANFSFVEKKCVFSTFSHKRNVCLPFRRIFSFPSFLIRSDFPAPVFRFHISLHIFSFSTSHLFKNFHRLPVRKLFSTNQKSFPYAFPLENSRKTKYGNPCAV